MGSNPFNYFENTGTSTAPVFVQRTDSAKNSDGVVDFAEFSEIHRKALDGSLEFRALADAMTSFDALTAQMDDDDDSDAAPDAGAG